MKITVKLCPYNLRREKSFLKIHRLPNFLVGQRHTVWHNDQLIVVIIQTMNNGDATTCKLIERMINAKDIRIQLFPVRRERTGDKSVVYGVRPAVLWMRGTEWTVHRDGDDLIEKGLSVCGHREFVMELNPPLRIDKRHTMLVSITLEYWLEFFVARVGV